MKYWPLLILLSFVGCNSEMADLSSIQGIRNPNDPLPQILDVSGPSVNLYVLNDNMEFYVTFNEPVNVIGTPLLNIIADNGPIAADYLSGSGSNILTFKKTIAADEYEITGIVLNGMLSLNGGSINSVFDQDPADLSYQSKTLSGVRIDAINTEFVAVIPPADGLYKLNDDLCFTLQYNAPVSFNSGPATLPITVGTTKAASFVSGDGSKKLRFCYPVEAGIDVDGISVGATINGGTLLDGFGDDVAEAFTSPGTFSGVSVDSVPPSIASITPPANAIYYTDEAMLFDVVFDEAVNVIGNPTLKLTIGSSFKSAQLVSGQGSNTLTFKYTVQTGDIDTNGIAISSTIVYPTGSNITDLAGNSIDPTDTISPPSLANVKVDGVVPSLLNTAVNTDHPIARIGETITVTLLYDETIYSSGNPKIKLDIGGTIKEAVLYDAAPNTGLVFVYDIEPHLKDTDGITIVSGIYGGTLKDGPTPNAHDISFSSFTSSANQVNSFAYISSAEVISDSEISGKPEGSYKAGRTIDIKFTFSDDITVDNSPLLPFTLDGTSKNFVLTAQTTNELTFSYTPSTGEIDLDGLDLAAAISLNGGSIKDSYDGPVELNLPSAFNPYLYLIPDSMHTWLDISDPTSTNISIDHVEGINSKAEANTPSLNGLPPYPTLVTDGGFKAANFSGSSIDYDYFSAPMSQMIIVYRAPATYSANNRLVEWGTNYFEFQYDQTIRTDCADCDHYDGTSWLSPINILFLNYYLRNETWSPSEKKMVSLKFNSGYYDMHIGYDFTGEIAEVITFSSTPTVAELNKIYQYLKTKHGVDF